MIYFEDLIPKFKQPIVIVGGGPAKRNYSNLINSQPTVIRCNNYWKPKDRNPEWAGTRITHRTVNSEADDVEKRREIPRVVTVSPLPASNRKANLWEGVPVIWARSDLRENKTGSDQETLGVALARHMIDQDIRPLMFRCGTNPDSIKRKYHDPEEEMELWSRWAREGAIYWYTGEAEPRYRNGKTH